MAKRRPAGDGMVRKREDGRWEGRIVVGHKENGNPIFRYLYAGTQKELSERLRQNIEAYQGAELTEDSRMPLNEWLDRWLESMEGTVRPNTLRGYRSYLANHVRPVLGEKLLNQITAADIRRWHKRMAQTLSSGTVERIHTTLHGALDAAKRAHLIPANPTERAGTPKFSYGPRQILTDEQVKRFLNTVAQDELWRDFFYTESTTGLRRGEICGLKREDFDEDAGTLKIRRTVRREADRGLTTGDTKTFAGTRTITLPPSTAETLRERKKAALAEWIFPNLLEPEQPMAPENAYRRMKEILKSAGLPNLRFHDLRHTFATHALASGVDVKTLSGILGHTRAAFTLDTYTHTTGDMQKRAAEIVGDFMTDIFGEELKPWEESAKTAKVPSA